MLDCFQVSPTLCLVSPGLLKQRASNSTWTEIVLHYHKCPMSNLKAYCIPTLVSYYTTLCLPLPIAGTRTMGNWLSLLIPLFSLLNTSSWNCALSTKTKTVRHNQPSFL